MTHDPRRSLRRSGEDGTVLLVIALALPVVVGMAAIVLDLGQGYVTGRQMQNASDAAAMAGARALDRVRLSGAPPSTVDETARLMTSRNGANDALVTCTVIRWDATPVGPCSDSASVTSSVANGVVVNAGVFQPTTFAGALGVTELRVDRKAAATVQPLVGQDAPLLACAFGQTADGKNPSPDLLVGSPGNYALNPGALGQQYLLHAPHVASCALGSADWKGDAGAGPFVLPGWLGIDTGVKAGPIRPQIAGQPGCGSSSPIGCVLALPICSRSNGGTGSGGKLFCERFGAFRLVAEKSNQQIFELIGAAEATSGLGGSGVPDANDLRLVKLVL